VLQAALNGARRPDEHLALIGLEDVLALPGGERAPGNASLVAAAYRRNGS